MQQRLSRYIWFSGALTSGLGFMVIVGWFAGNIPLIQIHASFVPMQFNTALSFFFCGLTLIFKERALRRPFLLCAQIPLFFGLFTLSQYVFGFDLGIDELFFKHNIVTLTSHPGRMAPNTALCFFLFGLTATLSAQAFPRRRYALAIGLGMVLLALSGVAIVGYSMHWDSGSGLGHFSRMAFHTAFGFCLLGSAEMVSGIWLSIRETRGLPKSLPYLAGLCIMLVSIFLWLALKSDEDKKAHSVVDQILIHFNAEIDSLLTNRFLALNRMSQRWAVRKSVPEKEWNNDAYHYLNDQPGYQALIRMDAQRQIFSAYPSRENLPLAALKDLAHYFQQAVQQKENQISDTFELGSGGKGFLFISPVFVEGRLEGFLVAVCDYQELLAPLSQSLNQGGGTFQMWLDNQLVFDGGRSQTEFTKTFLLHEHNKTWRIVLGLRPEKFLQLFSVLPTILLVGGLAYSLLAGFVLQLIIRLVRLNQLAKRQEDLLQNVLDTISDAVLVVDQNGAAVLKNKTGHHFLGMAHRQVAAMHHHEYWAVPHIGAPEKSPDYELPLARAMRGETVTNELVFLKNEFYPEGIYLEITALSLPLTTEPLFLNVFHDVTSRYKYTLEMKEANVALAKSNKDLEQFAFIASHDLREPLRKVRTFGQMLQTELSQMEERPTMFLRVILDATARMDTLLSSLLAYSRITTNAAPFSEAHLGTIINGVLADLALTIEENNAQIHVEGVDVTLPCDKSQIHQLFQNLIGNALKFRDAKRAPLINITARVQDGAQAHAGMVELEVKDNGIGFDEKFDEDIFKVFRRLHTRDQFPGTGMGLAICARIVERHKGTIKAIGVPGEGARFEIRLPSKQEAS